MSCKLSLKLISKHTTNLQRPTNVTKCIGEHQRQWSSIAGLFTYFPMRISFRYIVPNENRSIRHHSGISLELTFYWQMGFHCFCQNTTKALRWCKPKQKPHSLSMRWNSLPYVCSKLMSIDEISWRALQEFFAWYRFQSQHIAAAFLSTEHSIYLLLQHV